MRCSHMTVTLKLFSVWNLRVHRTEASQEVVAQQHRGKRMACWKSPHDQPQANNPSEVAWINLLKILPHFFSMKHLQNFPGLLASQLLACPSVPWPQESKEFRFPWHDTTTTNQLLPTILSQGTTKAQIMYSQNSPIWKTEDLIFFGTHRQRVPKTCRLPVVTRLFEVRLSCIQQLLAS